MLGIFLDTETNGLNPRFHKIVEIAFKILDLETGLKKEEYHSIIQFKEEDWKKSDPESLRINHFSWEEVKQGKSVSLVAEEIIQCFQKWNIQKKKSVFICQNPSFDRIFFSQLIDPDTQEKLRWPYHWLDLASMHWALSMERAKKKTGPLPWEIGYSKDMIAAYHKLPPENKPHRAMNGVSHLILCYQAVVGFPALV
jgi:DNA polymerase-3 subunit epsilon/oligoribonuclease